MRLVVVVLVLIVILAIGAAGLVGYELYQVAANPTAAPPLPTVAVNGRQVVDFSSIPPEQLAGAVRSAQDKLDQNVKDKQAFALDLTGSDIVALVVAQAGEGARSVPVSDVNLDIRNGVIALTANLRGTVPVPVAGTLTPGLQQGQLKLAVSGVKIGQLPVPADQIVGPLVDKALDMNASLAASGAVSLQSVEAANGKLRLIGLQRQDAPLDQNVAKLIKDAASKPTPSGSATVDVPGGNLVPPGKVVTQAGTPLYLALGDSLTAGVGVADKHEDFVSRLHGYLEKQTGKQWGLTNLGTPGESTASMLSGGQLRQAIQLLKQQPKQVGVITLGIGANDLLGHLASPACQTDPTGADCQSRLQAAVKAFPANYRAITDQLAGAVDPSTQVILMNVYNPFDFGTGLPAEQQSNQTIKALNDAIAAEARSRGWMVADASGAIGNKAAALTGILSGDVHPNAQGYQAIAFAFTNVLKTP